MKTSRIRLGEVLIKQGLLSADKLEVALELQKKTGRKLGKVLVEQGFIDELQIAEALAKQLNLKCARVADSQVDIELLAKMSEAQARKYRAIPVSQDQYVVIVGMSDPTDIFAYDELSKIFRKDIEIFVTTEEDILLSIDRLYSGGYNISSLAKELERDIKSVVGDVDLGNLAGLTIEETPVVKLLQSLFNDAVNKKASDIHIEPQKDKAIIRLRIDGVLLLQSEVDFKICAPLLSRLKIMSSLDIAEKRLPQDGRFSIKIREKNIDVRISTLPLNNGEGAVLRLLVQDEKRLSIDKIGMPDYVIEPFRKIIHGNEGMLLVTGPTGSGKTSTLYSSLIEINTIDKKIITIEDPVEYNLSLINQVQVNDKIGLTFSKVLRSVLRQDPDIIMIGEIRDDETAQIALRGAITGHLILSTIHTKDTVSTPVRLIDMGVPCYMVASALQGVLSQRLIRTNCEYCVTDEKIDHKLELWFRKFFSIGEDVIKFKKGRGCQHCSNTGYLGRIGVYELLEMDSELMGYLYNNELMKFSDSAKNKMNGKTIADGVRLLVLSGHTSAEEAKRMIG